VYAYWTLQVPPNVGKNGGSGVALAVVSVCVPGPLFVIVTSA
jgi:hypothetical protein